ncbi:hypothetical protein [Terrimonas pollutisoli]|uniref:hypothetical protein n=1 Tax=Terrimonas pollutisoli TaxID=3034147 RepID=UPI0023EBF6A3|nr:hypothetical protein [Terrimonas sp. H1YJ31]
MSTLISKTKKLLQAAGILAISATIFSFSSGAGGEGFEIYLNNKVVLQQFGNEMKVVKTLRLDQSNENDELSVRYHHCGKVGKNRVITIKDGNDNVLKQWKFTDASSAAASMTCKVKDILALQKGKDKTIKLYYASTELPQGRQLASIVAGTKAVAKL